MKAVDVKNLLEAGCGNPGCQDGHESLYIHSKCHAESDVEAIMIPTGNVVIRCAQEDCHELIAELELA